MNEDLSRLRFKLRVSKSTIGMDESPKRTGGGGSAAAGTADFSPGKTLRSGSSRKHFGWKTL
jgi:hypothetical protein